MWVMYVLAHLMTYNIFQQEGIYELNFWQKFHMIYLAIHLQLLDIKIPDATTAAFDHIQVLIPG
jgi:hypothetical protein